MKPLFTRSTRKVQEMGTTRGTSEGFCRGDGSLVVCLVDDQISETGLVSAGQRVGLGVASRTGTPHCDLDKYKGRADNIGMGLEVT